MGFPPTAIFLGAFASFAGFLFGYDTAYISGIKELQPFLRAFGDTNANGQWFLPTGTNSLLTSILSVGTCIGALAGSLVGDTLGRRYGIIAYIGVFCIGVALQTGVRNIPGFAIGRVLAGLGVGGTSCLVPIYQAECAPQKIRGFIVSAYQFFITVGLLLAAVVVNATKDINDDSSYRIPIALQFVWAAILVFGLVILPESPRWLMMKGCPEDAKKSLVRILGRDAESPEMWAEFTRLSEALNHDQSMKTATFLDCFRDGPGHTRQRVLTGMAMQGLQQLTGINFIFYYGTSVFQNAGIQNPFLISVATSVVNVGMTVPGMFAIDRLGRRTLMITGAIWMGSAQLVVAAVGTAIGTDNEVGQKVLIAFVCIYIAGFACTWGICTWTLTSEMYPYEVRGKGMALSTSFQWLLNFAIGYATPYMVDEGPGSAGLGSKVFFIWGGCCVICIVFSYFYIPETKGLTLEQIDLIFRNSTIIQSNSYRKQLLAEGDSGPIMSTGSEFGKTRETKHIEEGDASSH